MEVKYKSKYKGDEVDSAVKAWVEKDKSEVEKNLVTASRQYIDDNKQDISERVALGQTNTTSQYPNAKSVYDECLNIREVAEGKTKPYVIDTQSDITGTKGQDDNYTNVTKITGVTLSELKVGDNIFIKQLEVPDYWVSQITPSVSLNKLETSKVDLSGKLDKITTSGNFVYSHNGETQEEIRVSDSSSVIANAIVKRSSSGYINVPNPVSASNAVNKNYVDSNIASHHDGSKVDKVTTADTSKRAYTIDANATQSVTPLSAAGAPNAIAQYDSEGHLAVTNPRDNYDAVNLQTFNGGLSGKVDKVSSVSTYDRLYGIETNGEQKTYLANSTPLINGIAEYNGFGQLSTAAPTSNENATTKQYVDQQVAAKSVVTVSSTGTATDEVQYITVNGVEKKLAGGASTKIIIWEDE